MQFFEESDIKFIRLAFCDIFGVQKNIAIMVNQLPHAAESGISFDASAIAGFTNVAESDLFLVPDLDTFRCCPGGERGCVGALFLQHPVPGRPAVWGGRPLSAAKTGSGRPGRVTAFAGPGV